MMENMVEFVGFPKIVRLSSEVIVTEKIDGTNAQIYIPGPEDIFPPYGLTLDKTTHGMSLLVGSRTRWITPECDNHGFARWAYDHAEELVTCLGPGRHFGEWWGSGIQRGYGLPKGEKRFSLFNTLRWGSDRDMEKYPNDKPDCCHVVPVLWRGVFDTQQIEMELATLKNCGSVAAPVFMKPEGIVVYHIAGNIAFKKTIGDDGNKGDNR
jgi:hypothetical protein